MGFHFSNIYKPQALIFLNFLCELYIHLIFVEVLQLEKNSHFVEFEVLSCGCGLALYWQLFHKISILKAIIKLRCYKRVVEDKSLFFIKVL